MKPTIKKGTFTSIWDGGRKITTAATLDYETGYVQPESTNEDIEDLNVCEAEYFTDEDGTQHDVCPECHCHILKEKNITDTDEEGNELPEIAGIIICSDPYCPFEPVYPEE